MGVVQKAVAVTVTTMFVGVGLSLYAWKRLNDSIDRAVDEAWNLWPEDMKIV